MSLDLTKFNEGQKKAIQAIDGSYCVMAKAGSGKTAVLTQRIVNMIEHGIQPENILAITFTKKASIEMKERLERMIDEDVIDKITIGTFHGVFYRILKEEWRTLNNPLKDSELATDYWQKIAMKEILQPPSNKYPKGLNMFSMPLKTALGWIGYQKNNLITPKGELIINESIGYPENKLRKMYEEFELRKRYENKIDFDDMLIMTYNLFNDYSHILQRCKNKFKYILVDEFQDTNIAQYEILKQLAWEHKNLFVVGDTEQSIFSFRGGKMEIMLDFCDVWDAHLIALDINYRSSTNIVEWSNKLIKNNSVRSDIFAKAYHPVASEPVIWDAEDEEDEADKIGEEILRLLEDDEYKTQNIAILYRSNSQSRALEEAMINKKIPYIILGGQNFYNRKEIKDMMAYMMLIQDTDNDEAFERIVNKPSRYLGKAFLSELHDYANDKDISLFEALKKSNITKNWRYSKAIDFIRAIEHLKSLYLKPSQLIIRIRQEVDYDKYIKAEDLGEDGETEDDERIESLNSLVACANKFKTIDDFIEYTSSIQNNKQDKAEDNKVKLMSMHRSKGLEFPVVFVVGIADGVCPHEKSEDTEEERRLMYVAISRPKERLYITCPAFYNAKKRKTSIFIDELKNKKYLYDKEYNIH